MRTHRYMRLTDHTGFRTAATLDMPKNDSEDERK